MTAMIWMLQSWWRPTHEEAGRPSSCVCAQVFSFYTGAFFVIIGLTKPAHCVVAAAVHFLPPYRGTFPKNVLALLALYSFL